MIGIEALRKKFREAENELLAAEEQALQDLLLEVLLDECRQRQLQISIVPTAGGYSLEIGAFKPKIYPDMYSLVIDGWNVLKIIGSDQNLEDSDTLDIGFELIGPNRM